MLPVRVKVMAPVSVPGSEAVESVAETETVGRAAEQTGVENEPVAISCPPLGKRVQVAPPSFDLTNLRSPLVESR